MMFMIYSLGFALEKVAAMQEHGIRGMNSCYLHGQSIEGCFLTLVYFNGTWVSLLIVTACSVLILG